jgi:Family of unknown function (DUF5681)
MARSPRHPKSGNYRVGYGKPPKQHQFQRGRSGNPTGINRKPIHSTVPDLRASLQRELNKSIKIPFGDKERTVPQGEAGIGELVRQFVAGDPRARRDLFALADEYDIDLAPSKTIESALEEALSAEDEALLADFVRRHGGQYPLDSNSAEGGNLLTPPNGKAKLLAPPSEDSNDRQIVQHREHLYD